MHSIWPLYSMGPGNRSYHTALTAQRAKRKEDPALYQVPVSPSSLQKKNLKHLSYIFFWACEAHPISFCPSKLQGSTDIEIASSRDAEGKGSFGWGSLLLSFQTGSICRIRYFICHSPGKLLLHNWAGLIECSGKWPLKSLFSIPNFHFSWSFTTMLMIS